MLCVEQLLARLADTNIQQVKERNPSLSTPAFFVLSNRCHGQQRPTLLCRVWCAASLTVLAACARVRHELHKRYTYVCVRQCAQAFSCSGMCAYVSRHGKQAWCASMIHRHGEQAWCASMVCKHGGQAWCASIVRKHGVQAWCASMVCKHGAQA